MTLPSTKPTMKKLILTFVALSILVFSSHAQRIAVLSDIHVTPGNANERALRQTVNEINDGDFDLVVMNGDLTNEGSDIELINVKSILDSISAPLFTLPGNHETTWSQSATHTFPRLWGNDRFYTTVGDSLLIAGISCGPYMKMGDGHVKQEDLHWLRMILESNLKPGMKFLSFNHYPLLDDLDNYREYIELLQDYPVIGHICGHYHTWRYYNAGGLESGSDIECAMVRALDMGKGNYGYAIIDISPDWVHIYEKKIGEKPTPKIAFPIKTTHKKLKVSPLPEINAPEGFSINKIHTDSASVFTRLGIDKKNIYFGTSTGVVKAINKYSGERKWEYPTGSSLYSRPVVISNGNTVAVPAGEGIYFLDSKTGKKKGFDKSKEGPYVADGLVTPDGKYYLQGGYKRFEKRRASDGKLIWSYDSLFNYCQASPTVSDNEVIFGAWDTNLRSLNLTNGKLNWAWNNGKNQNMLGPGNVVPVITPERVYIVAPDRYMTSIDRKTGKTLWRDNSHKYREALGFSEDLTRIYAKTMDGKLVAVDATTPEFSELWNIDMGLGYEHAPCVIVEKDGIVYAGSRRGHVVLTDPMTKTIIADLPLGVSEVNGIDVDPSTGNIYVSLIEGTIWEIARNEK